jgi:hypothetical protein
MSSKNCALPTGLLDKTVPGPSPAWPVLCQQVQQCRQTVRSSRAEPTFSFAPRLVSSLFDSNGPLLQAPGSFPPSPSLSAVLTFDASAVASLLPVCLGTFDCTRSASAGLSRCSQRRLRKKKLTVSTVRESSLRPSLNFCPSGLGLRPVRS